MTGPQREALKNAKASFWLSGFFVFVAGYFLQKMSYSGERDAEVEHRLGMTTLL